MSFRLDSFVFGSAVALAAAFAAGGAGTSDANAATYSVLHAFCPDADYPTCSDGKFPEGAPVAAADGTIYGTASAGGAHGGGVLYALKPNGGGYSYRVIYSFCVDGSCSDGGNPNGPLIIDTHGSLYGTSTYGGTSYGNGSVYKFTPNASRTGGKLTVLYNFCSKPNCADGSQPISGVTYLPASPGAPYDGKSPLYGSTSAGGNSNSAGIAFKLSSVRGQTLRGETVLHVFCSATSCRDGAYPQALIVDKSGGLFGAAQSGGAYGRGLAFRIDAKTKKETALRHFCSNDQTYCYDGQGGIGPLARDSRGNLWGVTGHGGQTSGGTSSNHGVIYRLAPLRKGRYKYSVKYAFCTVGDCADGADPLNGVILDPHGNLFGVTSIGGTSILSVGTVFELAGRSKFKSLYSFCKTDCTDGRYPESGLAFDSTGNLYGTTMDGGNLDQYGHGRGVVFKLAH